MTGRLWFPQLDVYDAVRRIGGLLGMMPLDRPMSPERLFIIDFYMASPPLLHRTHMTQDARKLFSALKIPRPERAYTTFPSSQLLFHKMEEVQRQGLHALSSRGLLDLAKFAEGSVMPSTEGRTIMMEKMLALFSDAELSIGTFLLANFASHERAISELRQSSGLRRVVR